MEKITIKGIEVLARHGVFAQERIVGNRFLVDVIIEGDFTEAMTTDDINHTINYAQIVELVKKTMATPSNLIENVAHRIILDIKSSFPTVRHGAVTIHKPEPPISTPVATVSFTAAW